MPQLTNSERIERNTDAIRDLERAVDVLDDRTKSVRAETAVLGKKFDATKDDLNDRTARLEVRINSLEKIVETQQNRQWMVLLAVGTAILSLAVNLLVWLIGKLA